MLFQVNMWCPVGRTQGDAISCGRKRAKRLNIVVLSLHRTAKDKGGPESDACIFGQAKGQQGWSSFCSTGHPFVQ